MCVHPRGSAEEGKRHGRRICEMNWCSKRISYRDSWRCIWMLTTEWPLGCQEFVINTTRLIPWRHLYFSQLYFSSPYIIFKNCIVAFGDLITKGTRLGSTLTTANVLSVSRGWRGPGNAGEWHERILGEPLLSLQHAVRHGAPPAERPAPPAPPAPPQPAYGLWPTAPATSSVS
jgi:hypothetical protein